MGAFWNTCKCGKEYMWFSHTPKDMIRSKQCDECWKAEGITNWEAVEVEYKPAKEASEG